jgi:DNA-binding transcriptional ArsR family regulator
MAQPSPAQPVLVTEERNLTLDVLRALAHPARLELMAYIAAKGPICTCHLESAFDHSQPTISKHLGVLRRAGLIDGRREGRWVYHTANEPALDAARGFLEELHASIHRPHLADDCGDTREAG